jgi:hypothetical protein
MAMFVGVDVSLKTTSICFVEADGSCRRRMLWRLERGRPKGGLTSRRFWSCPDSRHLGSRNRGPRSAINGRTVFRLPSILR